MTDTVYTLVLVVPVLLIAITLHELMHALTSSWLGDDTARVMGRVSLNPMRHIDPYLTVALPILLALANQPIFGAAKPVQVNFQRVRWQEFGGALIAIAGPLTNVVLAVLSAAAIHLLDLGPGSGFMYDFLRITVLLNIGFFVFNSIPWPPLDGSRVLYAFAPRPVQEFMDSIERMGLIGLFLFIFIFFSFIGPLVFTVVRQLSAALGIPL